MYRQHFDDLKSLVWRYRFIESDNSHGNNETFGMVIQGLVIYRDTAKQKNIKEWKKIRNFY